MKLIEKSHNDQTQLKCPKCGGTIEHRLEREDGYIVNSLGLRETCFLPCDDYVCKKCKTEFVEEDS